MRRHAAVLLALAGAVVVAHAAAASSPWSDRARSATLVILARCEAGASDWEGGSIYTRSDVTVLEALRGAPDHTTTVRQPGGVVDGVGQRVSHVSLLEPGATYLLFLSRDDSGAWAPTRLGVNPVVGPQGAETVGGAPLDSVMALLGSAE